MAEGQVMQEMELGGLVGESDGGERVSAEHPSVEEPLGGEKPVEEKGTGHSRGLEFLLDIPLELTVEVGRARLEIRDLLSIGPGSLIELDKLAGDPLDVYVNDRLVARGEVVVINEKFGLKLTEVVSQRERIENLG